MRLLVWLLRFRHRRGYGVHSPFAFNFITSVIYERGEYYAYAELRTPRNERAKQVREAKKGHPKALILREKDERLLFRIINFAAPRTALIYGRDALRSMPYLQAGRRHCAFRQIEDFCSTSIDEVLAPYAPTSPAQAPLDFLYTTTSAVPSEASAAPPVSAATSSVSSAPWAEVFRRAIEISSPTACFVVHGIHRSRRDHRLWRELIADPRVRVTFDLHDFGVAFFAPHLQKQDYTVCYY